MQMYDRVHIVKDTKETLGTDYAVSHYLLASFIFSSLCNTQEQSPLCKTTSVTSFTHRSLVSKSAFSHPGFHKSSPFLALSLPMFQLSVAVIIRVKVKKCENKLYYL